MTPEDISELLTRLGIFPKPKPRTLDAAVKVIERQRWELVKIENEGAARAVETAHHPDLADTLRASLAGAIRARVKR